MIKGWRVCTCAKSNKEVVVIILFAKVKTDLGKLVALWTKAEEYKNISNVIL